MNRTHQHFSFCIALALFIICFAAYGQTPIVLDNEDATLEGVWTNGVMAPDKLGKDYRFAFCAEGSPTASATYRPKIPVAGKYHVEISFPKGANRSTNAPWLISYNGGTLTKNVNQRSGGEWLRIGTNLEFAAGTSGFVRLDNNSGEADTTSIGLMVVVADGVRFVPGDETTTTASPPNVPAIEVDDNDVELSGSWIDINSTSRQRGKKQHFIPTKEGQTATATFRPTLKAGKYHVEVWHTAGNNRSKAAPWVVVGADGETLATVDQTKSEAQWVRIVSDKNFAAGTGGYVQLHNGTGTTGTVVIADSVRFVPSGASTSSSASVTPVKPNVTYTLNVELAGSGSVTRSPDQIRYPGNSTVTLTAKPDEGFVFGGWTGDVNRMKNPLTVTMWKDRRITANFWAAGSGVIMDNTEADFIGDWSNPEKAWGGPRYDNYRFYSSVQGNSSASATYRPNLTKAGIYDIYVWYSDGPNRATRAPWEVVCKTGKETFHVNQVKNGGKWNLLASGKEFDAGDKGYVRLTNNSEPIPSVVIADAVAFVFVAAP